MSLFLLEQVLLVGGLIVGKLVLQEGWLGGELLGFSQRAGFGGGSLRLFQGGVLTLFEKEFTGCAGLRGIFVFGQSVRMFLLRLFPPFTTAFHIVTLTRTLPILLHSPIHHSSYTLNPRYLFLLHFPHA